jgi:DNA replication factor GINS
MNLDDLRSILLSERETGRLTAVAPDIFEKGHAELAALTKRVYAFEDPLSEEARELIEETIAIRETMHDLFAIRSRKILALTIMHAEGNYYDREEVKRLIPVEREMFDKITDGIEQCQSVLLHNTPRTPIVAVPAAGSAAPVPVEDEIGSADFFEDESPGADRVQEPDAGERAHAIPQAVSPLDHPCALVRVLENMDSFMGVDGRIYTLSKGDIVTLPERNAAVLSERNIVLNINLCK